MAFCCDIESQSTFESGMSPVKQSGQCSTHPKTHSIIKKTNKKRHKKTLKIEIDLYGSMNKENRTRPKGNNVAFSFIIMCKIKGGGLVTSTALFIEQTDVSGECWTRQLRIDPEQQCQKQLVHNDDNSVEWEKKHQLFA